MSTDIIQASGTELIVEDYFQQAQTLIDKGLVPKSYKNAEQVVLAISFGRQIDLDPISAVNAIDIIEGKPAIQARMIPGLLARKNIAIQIKKDYEPVLERKPAVMKDNDGNPLLDEEGNLKYYKDPDGNIIYKEKEIDKETVVEFIRYFPNIGVVRSDVPFRWSDAVRAGWTSKQNWSKMPRFMMMARCIARGARLYGSDAIAGQYDDYEVAEFTNADFDIDEDNNIIIKSLDSK